MVFIFIFGLIILLFFGGLGCFVFKMAFSSDNTFEILNEEFEGCEKRLVTIINIYTKIKYNIGEDLNDTYPVYVCNVIFIDEQDKKRLGYSRHEFISIPPLEEGQSVMAYCKPIIRNKEIEGTHIPEFEVHFCDRKIYEHSKNNNRKISFPEIVFGIAFILAGIFIFLSNLR